MTRERHNPVADGLICAYELDGRGGGRALGWPEILQTPPAGAVRWVHLDFSHPRAHDWLREGSGIEGPVVDAMLEDEIRPRSLQAGNGVLTILRGVNLNPGSEAEDMVSLRVWLEPGRIVTARRRSLMTLQRIQEAITAGTGPTSPGSFLSELLWLLGDRIGEVIDSIDASIEAAEVAMAASRGRAYHGEFGALRRKTAHIRRYLAPQREALDRLTRMQDGLFSRADLAALHEETNRMTLFIEELDLARERAMVAQEEMLSSLAHEQNTKIYLLSLVSSVFLPLTFLTGLMGMNVAGMPGSDHPTAFAILVALMLGIGAAILLLFRWKRWL